MDESACRDFDVNCDLGEGEPAERTAALLALVDSANIACGGHAGDDDTMRRCLVLAAEKRVWAGAHPGWPGRSGFGREPLGTISAEALADVVIAQVERLRTHASALGLGLHHLKLHGALYHAVEADSNLATAYLELVSNRWPRFVVYGRAGGAVVAAAARFPRLAIWSEGFLDRGLRDDGTLVPRGDPSSLIHEPAVVLARLDDLRRRGGCRSASGAWVTLRPATLCVHGDSPGAMEVLAAVRTVMPRRVADLPGTAPGTSWGQG